MFEYKKEYSWLTNICLNLTDACPLACRYCLLPGTKILCTNGRMVNIEDLQVGDEILGFDEINETQKQRKIFPTKITQLHQHQVNKILKITMSDGKQLFITDNHKVLNGRGKWTEARNLKEKTGQIMSLGYLPVDEDKSDILDIEYIKGYFIGMWLTDGSFKHYVYDQYTKGHQEHYRIRLAVKDDEIIERMRKYCDILNFSYTLRDFNISKKENLWKPAIFSSQANNYNLLQQMKSQIKDNYNNLNYLKGFVAACYDAEGHIDKDGYVLSISNSDSLILDTWKHALGLFGFIVKQDSSSCKVNKPVYRSRLITQHKQTGEEQIRFFNIFQPAVKRKREIVLNNCCPFQRNNIQSIETIEGEFKVYNIGTESHTYIANGLTVHNCFVEQHPHYMPLKVAKSAVNFILANLEKKRIKNPEERASITYFGGEPTVMWDEVIVPLTTWVKENDYPIDFTMTTNGVLLNKERIQFLKDNHIVPLLSIDGAKKTQDYNRPRHDGSGSFDAVSAIIPDLLEAFPNTTFRATIWPETAHHTFENYMFAVRQNFQNVFFIPDYRHTWTEEQKQILWEQVTYIYNYMRYCFENDYQIISNSLIEDSFRQMLNHDIAIYNDFQLPKTNYYYIQRCGLGTTFGAIGYDGNIYGCQEQPSKDDKNIFLIGNLKNGIDQTLHSNLLSLFSAPSANSCEDKEKCNDCPLRFECNRLGCPSSNWDLFQDFHKHTQIECEWKQCLLFNSINLNNILVEQNNYYFKEYLNTQCSFKSFLKEGC